MRPSRPDVAVVGEQLERARVAVRPTEQATTRWPSLDEPTAWQVQDRLTRMRADSDRVVGHKVGLTGLAARHALGRVEPVSGRVFAQNLWPSGTSLHLADWIRPKLEPECAFIFPSGLSGPGLSPGDVRDRVGLICPAFEIADTRYGESAATAADLIADNAAGGGAVLNHTMTASPDQVDFSHLEVDVHVDGRRLEAARPPEQSDPYRLIAWLANSLAQRGLVIEAGQFVITGSWVTPIQAVSGLQVRASYPGIGSVDVAVG